MANQRFEHPSDLGPAGREAWDKWVEHFGESARAIDTVLLTQFCRVLDGLPAAREAMESNARNGVIRYGVLIDKVCALSAKLGFSALDRKNAALPDAPYTPPEEQKPKRSKTKLDDLTPEMLGLPKYVPIGEQVKG